jgi:hypothetical protein
MKQQWEHQRDAYRAGIEDAFLYIFTQNRISQSTRKAAEKFLEDHADEMLDARLNRNGGSITEPGKSTDAIFDVDKVEHEAISPDVQEYNTSLEAFVDLETRARKATNPKDFLDAIALHKSGFELAGRECHGGELGLAYGELLERAEKLETEIKARGKS